MTGAILLGAVARRTNLLAVACGRCRRRGQLRTMRLLAEHGPNMSMMELLRVVAAYCPRIAAAQPYDACGVHYPQLPSLFM